MISIADERDRRRALPDWLVDDFGRLLQVLFALFYAAGVAVGFLVGIWYAKTIGGLV